MDESPVQTTALDLRIVETLVDMGGAGVTELATAVDVPKSTVFDHLKALERAGYVARDGQKYRASLEFISLAGRIRESRTVYRAARGELKPLANKTDLHVGLIVEEDGEAVLLDSSTSSDAASLPLNQYAGIRMLLHCSAGGKAILAHLGEERITEIFDQHGLTEVTDSTTTDEETLLEDFVEIRERGFAVSRGERIEGLTSIAAPIIDPADRVRGSISVYGPIGRIDDSAITEIAQTVIETSNVVEMNLRYRH